MEDGLRRVGVASGPLPQINALRMRAETRSMALTLTTMISITAQVSAYWKPRMISHTTTPIPPPPTTPTTPTLPTMITIPAQVSAYWKPRMISHSTTPMPPAPTMPTTDAERTLASKRYKVNEIHSGITCGITP